MTSSHRPSWVQGANDSETGFTLANLPFCVYRPTPSASDSIGVGVGDFVFDLRRAAESGVLDLPEDVLASCLKPRLNDLFARGRHAPERIRRALQALFDLSNTSHDPLEACLVRRSEVTFQVPFEIGDYTDFLTSYHHAFNVGSLFRPDRPVLPNFKSMPIAYHGRSSSIIISGEPVRRPRGQSSLTHGGSAPNVHFGPSQRLDFELELGAFIATGNPRGRSISLMEADEHIAGLCLLNDWSARDIQAWESQPLGPFQGKNFATSISPWVVTLEALEPYRSPRAPADPPAFDYLTYPESVARPTFEIFLEVRISSKRMRETGQAEQLISRSVFNRDSYWTFGQMIAHHTINGCNLRTGDLLGSGTLSGPERGNEGSLVELTRGGKEPLTLTSGERRAFLEDGDEVVLSAYCRGPGLPRLTFGECRAQIISA